MGLLLQGGASVSDSGITVSVWIWLASIPCTAPNTVIYTTACHAIDGVGSVVQVAGHVLIRARVQLGSIAVPAEDGGGGRKEP